MIGAVTLFFTGCEKEMDGGVYRVYNDKMIDELMEENGLTAFLSIVERAELTGTIHAFGTNTLFAPDNAAVDIYLQNLGKSINDLTKEEAESIVKYHLIRDTLTTADFVDGRMKTPNFLKKYLTTKKEAEGSSVYERINRQAKLIHGNLRGANGILHVINQVLTPPENSITDAIRALPESEYSLIKTLFEESGWADSLDTEKPENWFTFFVQSNQSFKEAGIDSKDALLERLRENTPGISDDVLIYNFIGYRAANRLMYVVDLLSASGIQTLIPKQIITLKRNQDVILMNSFEQFNEAGTPIIRSGEYTDLSCSNGVLQEINGNIEIKNRTAYRVYWDVSEQPELMAKSNFRKAGTNIDFARGELSEITWGGKDPRIINYYCSEYPTILNATDQFVYRDLLTFGFHTNTTRWMEFKLPVLVEGKYKVWLCYRRLSETPIKFTFKQQGYDDQVLPYIIRMSEYNPNPATQGSHEAVEQLGFKQYTAKAFAPVMVCRLIGIIDVQTTDRHILRFDAQTGGRASAGYEVRLDMIQFIPIEENQLFPRVDMKGTLFYDGMDPCEAWPYDCVTEEVEE
jgi:uncharacterized surface protein with fasciclin (FAS1) repeats